jgi:prohibitin 2
MKGREYITQPPIQYNTGRLLRIIGIGILVFVIIVLVSSGTYIVQPGHRGVAVTLGKVAPEFKREGFGFKQPFVTHIHQMSVRQSTRAMRAECYSADLQQVKMEVEVLYRVPEQSVIKIFQQYAGEPFDNLIAPRVQEAIKEIAAAQSAEQIVKKREEVKLKSLDLARNKVGAGFLEIVDLVLYNLTLSPELEQAIEQKMVQEQEAAKAKFTQLKAQIEAETAIIRAKGEAESIAVRGQALRANPEFIKLQIVQNWNGKSPLVVGADGGANMLLDINSVSHPDVTTPARPKRQLAPGTPSRRNP